MRGHIVRPLIIMLVVPVIRHGGLEIALHIATHRRTYSSLSVKEGLKCAEAEDAVTRSEPVKASGELTDYLISDEVKAPRSGF